MRDVAHLQQRPKSPGVEYNHPPLVSDSSGLKAMLIFNLDDHEQLYVAAKRHPAYECCFPEIISAHQRTIGTVPD